MGNPQGEYIYSEGYCPLEVYADDPTDQVLKLERFVKITKDRIAAEIADDSR